MQNFSPVENFHQFRYLPSLAKFLSCVNDYIEDVVTFTAMVKIYSTKYLIVARLGEIFVKYEFSCARHNMRSRICAQLEC